MPKNDELQKQTLRVLTELGTPEKPLSARAAGEKLSIGYNQIADMAKGKSPGEKTLIKFAGALGESPADWLRYAGKHDFAKNISNMAVLRSAAGAASGSADRPGAGGSAAGKTSAAPKADFGVDPGDSKSRMTRNEHEKEARP